LASAGAEPGAEVDVARCARVDKCDVGVWVDAADGVLFADEILLDDY
jgi:hypothetical protein